MNATNRLQHEYATQESRHDQRHTARCCVRNPVRSNVENDQQKHRDVYFVQVECHFPTNDERQDETIVFVLSFVMRVVTQTEIFSGSLVIYT